jgi:hypothetical protein
VIKKYSLAVICILLCVAIFPSCRTIEGTSSNASPSVNSTDEIRLFLTDKPSVPYKEIARVQAYKFTVIGIPKKQDEIYENLKNEARTKGANAIINISEDIASIYGVAVLIASNPSKQTSSASTNADIKPVAKENTQAILVVKSTANVRSEPNTKSKIITTLKPGTEIQNLGKSGDWFNIKLSTGLTGWISSNLVAVKANP